MKLIQTFLIAIMVFLSVGITCADVPSKKPINSYAQLWQNSPFTSKPQVEQGMIANPLEDFTLTGIAPVPGGYRITIVNKKNPEMKKVIEPGVASEFQVVSVNRNSEKALGTAVVLTTGSMQGTVTFEPESITLNAAPAKQQNPNQTQANPVIPPGIPNLADADPNQLRQPRPRIVPPPQPAGQMPQGIPSR